MIYNLIRKTMYIISYLIEKYTPLKKCDGFIFCYHSIADDNWEFSVSPKEFIKQVDFLMEKYQNFSMQDFENYMSGKLVTNKPFFMITFDDGYKNIYQMKTYLKSKGIKPVSFLLSDSEYANRKELDNSLEFLSMEEVKQLKNDGWDFGSHSATHTDFNKLSDNEIEYEVINSKNNLEKSLGFEIKYFSYPKGRYNERVKKAVEKAGYTMAFSMDNEILKKDSDKYSIPRVGVMNTHSFTEFMSLPLTLSTIMRNVFFSGLKASYE